MIYPCNICGSKGAQLLGIDSKAHQVLCDECGHYFISHRARRSDSEWKNNVELTELSKALRFFSDRQMAQSVDTEDAPAIIFNAKRNGMK